MPLVRFFLRLLLSILLIFEISALAQGSFTLEQVLSSPFPDGLVAAEHGNRVAWVFTAKGVRNLASWAIWAVARRAAKISKFLQTASRLFGPPRRSCGWRPSTASSKPRNWPRFEARRYRRNGHPMESTSHLSACAIRTA